MRTQEERLQAVERLKINKEKCKKFNFFGNDNRESISIMIHVIENNLSLDEISQKYYDDEYISAISAFEYLTGEYEIEDILFPENK